MTIDDYRRYTSQYVKGAKKISIRSTEPVVEARSLTLKIQPSYGNYNLFFSQNGRLIKSVHPENFDHKIEYAYNPQGELIMALQTRIGNGEIVEYSEFDYDDQGRVRMESCRIYMADPEWVASEENVLSYAGNTQKVIMSSDFESDGNIVIFITYDEHARAIEERALKNGDEIIWLYKYRYGNNQSVIREIYVGGKSGPEGLDEWTYTENGLVSGCRSQLKDTIIDLQYIYTFDNTGRWISRVTVENGVPQYYCERVIEYF